ncbi:MAG: hypothetical protein ACW985_03000, partial [Candidatus Thorarchaeota archaeon]
MWKDSEVVRRLRRYRSIIEQERYTKYLLAKDIITSLPLDSAVEELWMEHEALSAKHSDYVHQVDCGGERSAPILPTERSFLDLKIELANRILQDCQFC